jgi:hypothetical protein
MNEAEVIRQMREHLEGLFPKDCMSCGKRFDTLRDYLKRTTHYGPTMPYDAMAGNWRPAKPIGMVTLANCPCGNTLSLSSKGMPLEQLWILMAWARKETKKRCMSPQELLNYLRDEICQQVLSVPNHSEV